MTNNPTYCDSCWHQITDSAAPYTTYARHAELLLELVELRARNARLEKLAAYIKDHEEKLVRNMYHSENDRKRYLQDLYYYRLVEDVATPPPGFADKVLKLAAAGCKVAQARGTEYHFYNPGLKLAFEQLTPEEAKLLEGFADA